MATTIVPIAGSPIPFSKMFVLTGDGVAGTFPLDDGSGTSSCLAGALDEGPLRKALLATPPATLANFNLNQARGDEIRIYDVPLSLADASLTRQNARTIAWVSNADPAVAGLQCTLEQGDTLIIEIRLNHTTQA